MSSDLFKELRPKGFIGDFTKDICESCPGSNMDYVQMIAESVLGASCVNIKTFTSIGEVLLNPWGLGIAPSGFNKSLPFKYYVGPLFETVEENLVSEKYRRLTLPTSFSPEGLIQVMTMHEEPFYKEGEEEVGNIKVIRNKGLLYNDELTRMVKGIKDKKWMTDVSELLSHVYDGRIPPHYTKGSGWQFVPECVVSFASATTPYLYKILSQDFFTQGLGNRLNFVVYDPPKQAQKVDPEEFFSRKTLDDRREVIEKFSDELLSIYNSNLSTLILTPSGAGEIWSRYKFDLDQMVIDLSKSKDEKDILRGSYYQRSAEKVIKLAGIYGINEAIDRVKTYNPAEMNIPKDIMAYAIERQKRYDEYFELFLSRWITSSGTARTDLVDIERMMNIVLARPLHLISGPQWMLEAGYGFKNKFYELKAYLLHTDCVRELTEDEKKRLRSEMKEALELKRIDTKVYSPTDGYYKRRRIEKPR